MLNPRLLTDDRLAAILRSLAPDDPEYPAFAAEWERRAEHARRRAAVAGGWTAVAASPVASTVTPPERGHRTDATRAPRRAAHGATTSRTVAPRRRRSTRPATFDGQA